MRGEDISLKTGHNSVNVKTDTKVSLLSFSETWQPCIYVLVNVITLLYYTLSD